MPKYSSSAPALTAEELIRKAENKDGMLCQCAGCKAIRVDEGNWKQLGVLELPKDLELKVTHGLCPRCEREATRTIDQFDD